MGNGFEPRTPLDQREARSQMNDEALPLMIESEARPPDEEVSYPFIGELASSMASGRSRSLVLSGNVQDLFYSKKDGRSRYVPLVQLLIDKFSFGGKVVVGGEDVDLAVLHMDLNDGIRFLNGCEAAVRNMFEAWAIGIDKVSDLPNTRRPRWADAEPSTLDRKSREVQETLDKKLQEARSNNGVALLLLRRFVEASQATVGGPKFFIVIQAADLLVPAGEGDVGKLQPGTVRKIAVLEDWFTDPRFMDGRSTVVLLSESYHSIHPRITRLPQVVNVDVPAPDQDARGKYAWWVTKKDPKSLAADTAGLDLHSLRQLLVEHPGGVPPAAVTRRVSEFIKAQLGDAVRFYRPNHSFAEVRGFSHLKRVAREDIIPRLQANDDSAPSVIIACGPIGCGKTHFFDAVAHEMSCPVLELGNLRSQWYGGTDVIVDRVERIVKTLPKVLIIVDEADTAFGGVGRDAHETERRLTGRIQQMMSDPSLRGRVSWILMTARIDQLSPDIRRPGRADMIIPVLDPDDDDRVDFVKWLFEVVAPGADVDNRLITKFMDLTKNYSAGLYGVVRSRLKARKAQRGGVGVDDLLDIIMDTIEPNIRDVRQHQTYQALLNCTSVSLLPPKYLAQSMEENRKAWSKEVSPLRLIRD